MTAVVSLLIVLTVNWEIREEDILVEVMCIVIIAKIIK